MSRRAAGDHRCRSPGDAFRSLRVRSIRRVARILTSSTASMTFPLPRPVAERCILHLQFHRLSRRRRAVQEAPRRTGRRTAFCRPYGHLVALDDPLRQRAHGRERRQATRGRAVFRHVQSRFRRDAQRGVCRDRRPDRARLLYDRLCGDARRELLLSSRSTMPVSCTRSTIRRSSRTRCPRCAKCLMRFARCSLPARPAAWATRRAIEERSYRGELFRGQMRAGAACLRVGDIKRPASEPRACT